MEYFENCLAIDLIVNVIECSLCLLRFSPYFCISFKENQFSPKGWCYPIFFSFDSCHQDKLLGLGRDMTKKVCVKICIRSKTVSTHWVHHVVLLLLISIYNLYDHAFLFHCAPENSRPLAAEVP